MSVLDPSNTTMGDLLAEALKLSGRLGIGQTALAEDAILAWTYLQWMLQEWERKRWLVYRIVNLAKVTTGATTYSIGPGADFDTGANSVRPAKVESAFIRQVTVAAPNQPDWPLELMNSRQDYDRIRLKQLANLSSALWYDPTWPLGTLYPWPIPLAALYELHVSVLTQLPYKFLTQADVISLPFEYYWAIVTNLAIRLRGRFGIGTFPGDELPGNAKESLQTLHKANIAIPRMELPPELTRSGGGYNIFSDRFN
jgi:hypothetical protein